MAGHSASDVDREIGQRIRKWRLQKNVTQSNLGGSIGVTFQQIQKYENGINRLSCGRLLQIAESLDVGVGEFLEGLAHRI